MHNKVKNIKKVMLVLIIVIVVSVVSVSATVYFNSENIAFEPENTNWNVSNTSSALNDLYDTSTTKINNFKSTIATAITNNGVLTLATDSAETMANNIEALAGLSQNAINQIFDGTELKVNMYGDYQIRSDEKALYFHAQWDGTNNIYSDPIDVTNYKFLIVDTYHDYDIYDGYSFFGYSLSDGATSSFKKYVGANRRTRQLSIFDLRDLEGVIYLRGQAHGTSSTGGGTHYCKIYGIYLV